MSNCRGKLYFNYGTMSAGKSLHLLATAHNFQEHNIPFVIFKSSIDTRDGDSVIHSRAIGNRECVSISTDDNLYNIIGEMNNRFLMSLMSPIKWVLVDEAQFLTPNQVEELAAIVDNFGISVICYGLRTDFKTNLFPGSKRLFELADSFEEIKSSCDCNNKTIVNARIDSFGNIVLDGEQVEVGGDDRYVSMCRKCYFERTNNPLYIDE